MEHWAVFISGTGSNLGGVMECVFSRNSVKLVVSSKSHAYGLKKAKRYGITTKVLSSKIDWQELLSDLQAHGISKIFLAGFMKILPESFIRQWQKPIVNIHPSLLPKYPGLKSIQRAFQDQAPMGCTLHEVIAQVDEGPIIASQQIPPVSNLDTAEFLIHTKEQKLGRKLFTF